MNQPKSYPLKDKRLEQLYYAGFNIVNFICFMPGQLDPVRLEKFFDSFKNKNGISLRHFHQDETRFFKCPVKYEVTDWKTALRFCQEHNKQFFTLCNEAIPLKDAIYGGNVWLLDEHDFMVEYFDGPGSPRDIENKELKHFKRSIGQTLPKGTPTELVQLGSLFAIKKTTAVRPLDEGESAHCADKSGLARFFFFRAILYG